MLTNFTFRASLGGPNPLRLLEDLWVGDEKDLAKRQVGFCAQWCLDNLCELSNYLCNLAHSSMALASQLPILGAKVPIQPRHVVRLGGHTSPVTQVNGRPYPNAREEGLLPFRLQD